MSTIEPDSGRDTVADWPADDWDDTGDWDTTPPPASRSPREVEVVPSRWADRADEIAAAPASRRRWWILAAAVVVAIAVTVWWLLERAPDGPTVTIAPAAPPSQDTPAPSTQPDVTADVPVPTMNTPVPTGQPATGPAADVAAGFAADYANPGAGKDDWLNRVSRWTAPQLLDGYRLTDPNRLPAAQLQRLSPPLDNDSGTVIYDAFYDTLTLEIRVAFIDDRWQVIAALDTHPFQDDVSPPGSTPPQTTPYLPPDVGAPQP